MAEAAVERRIGRFYCHQCSTEITPNIPEYTCPRCDSGFIEEVTASSNASGTSPREQSPQRQSQDAAAQFAELWTQALLGSAFAPMNAAGARPSNNQGPGTSGSVGPLAGPSGGPSLRVVRTMGARNPYMEGLVNYFLNRLGGEAIQVPVNAFHLHGNPADYAWGAGGLDSIITQLLNQLENSGPPPAEKEKVDSLPHVNVTQEQVDRTLQCTVCMEDFALGESVRRLPCEHHYHNDCILPWLELHGTCPVCRKDLNGQDTSRAGEDPPFPSPDDPPSSTSFGGMRGTQPSSSSSDTNPSLD